MDTLYTQMPRIREKLQMLLKEQHSLQRASEKLQETVQEQQATIEKLQEQNELLNQQVAILKTASGEMDSDAKKDFEKRINQYLKDIDGVIAHLNQ